MKRIKACLSILLTGALCLSFLSSCSSNRSAEQDIFAMDTYMNVAVYGKDSEEALEAAVNEINRLDALFSVGKEESEISALNQNGSATLSADASAVVEAALELYESTDGAFDITIYPVMDLWGFYEEPSVPSRAKLKSALALCDSSKIRFEPTSGSITLGAGQKIDLGGIAKGYTSDVLLDLFEDYNLTGALISLGGNIVCYKSNADGSGWRVAIQNPDDPDGTDYLGVLTLTDCTAITSGAYERNFTDESTGKVYHHIIDPSTGYPAESGLKSVTVVSQNGTLGDGLSTACYIMGLSKSIQYWRASSEDFGLVLQDEDGNLYVTENLKDQFESDFEYTVVEK